MKQLIMAALLLPALMGCGNEPAQEEQEATPATEATATPARVDVPAVVAKAFAAQFPTCTDVVWEMEDANTYEADFKENGDPHSASYTADGAWVETETPLTRMELPDPVLAAIDAGYLGQTVKEAEELRRPAGFLYEVELEKDGHIQEVVFTAEGVVVNTKAEEAEEGGEDAD